MPSPVGHGLAGLVVHVAASRDERDLGDLRRMGLVVGAALAPDVDLLFRLVDGRNHHDHETHSIGFALGAAVLAALIAIVMEWRRPLALGAAAGAGWLSHLLLDYLNVDTSPPIGLMAFWPLSHTFYKFPWPLFLDIGRTLNWATVRHDALAAAWEAAVLAPILFGVRRLRHFERH
jgi:inner membrane protein